LTARICSPEFDAQRFGTAVRVLAIGINYWPETTGIGPFTTGRCEHLAKCGHAVTVCTTFPYYPQWRTWDGWRGRIRALQERNGVRIRRFRIYVPARVTPLRRILHEGSFIAASIAGAVGAQRPDVILTLSPPLGLALAAISLSRRWGTPYVFHVADLQPDAAVELGMLRQRNLAHALYALERLAYRRAAMVSTLTDAMRKRLLAKGLPEHKVVLAPDWAAPALFSIPLTSGGAAFRSHNHLDGRVLVVHAGNMGVKQGLEVVVEAAAIARKQNPELMFLLVGDGAMRARLEESSRALALENLRILPLLPSGEFHELLAAADLCLISQQRCVADNVFPSKLMTLLAAGKPVVASLSGGSEGARVLNQSGAGVCCEPENPAALLAAIAALGCDRERRDAMAASGRTWAALHWNRDAILREFEACLQRVAAPAQSSAASPVAPIASF
jgi:colanic acid biosynthesis glycosyl transferase WcaI